MTHFWNRLATLAASGVLMLAGCTSSPAKPDPTPHTFGEPVNYRTNYSFESGGKTVYFASDDELKFALSQVARPQPTATAPK